MTTVDKRLSFLVSKEKLNLYYYCKFKMKKKQRNWRVSEIWSRKFYDPNVWKNSTKIISAKQQNGSRIKRFRKAERGDVDDVLLEWIKQQCSYNVPVIEALLMIIFVLPK